MADARPARRPRTATGQSPTDRLDVRRVATPLVRKQIGALERELGGRQAVVAALAQAPKSRSLDYLLGILGDPTRATLPLADLCAVAGITVGEVLEAYRRGELARAQVLATQKLGQAIPGVVEDTLKRAVPQQQVCPTCRGTTTVVPEKPARHRGPWNPEPEPCPDCWATPGTVTIAGDLEHKKLALEMGQLAGQRGGGVSVSVSQQVGVAFGTAGGALERLQTATDQILYGTAPPAAPDVQEGEVVEAAAAPTPAMETSSLDTDWRGEAPGEAPV